MKICDHFSIPWPESYTSLYRFGPINSSTLTRVHAQIEKGAAKEKSSSREKGTYSYSGLFFLCFAGLPPTVLLLYWVGLYWVGLPSAVLGPSVLSKGVETGLTGTQIGPACAQIMPRLPGAYLWQVELF